jgi:RNA polymerase sigma-70 factor (ECF subfamily)
MTETELLNLALAHLDRMHRFALQLCRDRDAAEDLVQEAFVRALAVRDQLRDASRALPWLLSVVRSRFLEQSRRARRRLRLELVAEEAELADPPIGNLEEELLRGVLSDEVARAVAALPEEQRTCVWLCDVEGLSYHYIAEVVGCPAGTVRSRIARARARLMESLARYAAERGIGRGGRQ